MDEVFPCDTCHSLFRVSSKSKPGFFVCIGVTNPPDPIPPDDRVSLCMVKGKGEEIEEMARSLMTQEEAVSIGVFLIKAAFFDELKMQWEKEVK